MGCSSCGGKRANVAYEVTFGNGAPKQKYDTIAEAKVAMQGIAGSSFRAVAK